MPVLYALEVKQVDQDVFEARQSSRHQNPEDTTVPLTADSFGEGIYFVEAGKVHKPSGPLPLEELRGWFAKLDGMTDKEAGGTVTCKVRQLLREVAG